MGHVIGACRKVKLSPISNVSSGRDPSAGEGFVTYKASIFEALDDFRRQSRGSLLVDIALRGLVVKGYLVRHVYLQLQYL